MLTKQEFNDAEILRNTPFTKGAIRYALSHQEINKLNITHLFN